MHSSHNDCQDVRSEVWGWSCLHFYNFSDPIKPWNNGGDVTRHRLSDLVPQETGRWTSLSSQIKPELFYKTNNNIPWSSRPINSSPSTRDKTHLFLWVSKVFRWLVYFTITSYSETVIQPCSYKQAIMSAIKHHCSGQATRCHHPSIRSYQWTCLMEDLVIRRYWVVVMTTKTKMCSKYVYLYSRLDHSWTMATLRDILEGSVFQCLLCLIQTERRWE